MPQYALQRHKEVSYESCSEELLPIYSFIIVSSIESIICLQKAYMNHNFNFIIQKVQQILVSNFAVHKLAPHIGNQFMDCDNRYCDLLYFVDNEIRIMIHMRFMYLQKNGRFY